MSKKRTKEQNIKYNTRRNIKNRQKRYIDRFCKRKGVTKEAAEQLEVVKNVLCWIELIEYRKAKEKLERLKQEE